MLLTECAKSHFKQGLDDLQGGLVKLEKVLRATTCTKSKSAATMKHDFVHQENEIETSEAFKRVKEQDGHIEYAAFTYLEPTPDFSPYTGNCDAGYVPNQLVEGWGQGGEHGLRCECKETGTT